MKLSKGLDKLRPKNYKPSEKKRLTFKDLFKRSLGNPSDPRCRRTHYNTITRKICRTQCKFGNKDSCRLGY